MPQAEEISQITDATERLSYVVRLTEAAANRTMDLVENATPLVNGMANEAKALSTDWVEDWRGWAIKNRINPLIVGFLGTRPDLLFDMKNI